MMQFRRTAIFGRWLDTLRDRRAAARVEMRIDRLRLGNPGDVKAVGHGVSEMRIDYGPGYRIYFIQRGCEVLVLLCGGDKSSQKRDIEQAHALAEQE
nr:type II toxin-antitoxin system RelE/ParE family toxin [Methylobacterium sp.]